MFSIPTEGRREGGVKVKRRTSNLYWALYMEMPKSLGVVEHNAVSGSLDEEGGRNYSIHHKKRQRVQSVPIAHVLYHL